MERSAIVSVDLPHGASRAVLRRWLTGWLHNWKGRLSDEDLDDEVTFLFCVLRRTPAPGDDLGIGGNTAISECGFGLAPVAPEGWLPQPLATLIALAVDDLAPREGG